MIENDVQLKVTQDQIQRLEYALAGEAEAAKVVAMILFTITLRVFSEMLDRALLGF